MSKIVPITFDEIAFTMDLREYLDPIGVCKTAKKLEDHLLLWMIIFPDAWAQCPTVRSFGRFLVGLDRERSGGFAGEDFAREFGSILIPERSILAMQLVELYNVPFGAALKRLADLRGWGITEEER